MNQIAKVLPKAFLGHLKALEQSYLSVDDPIRQSGFSGGRERWRAERSVILDAVNADGEFIDIGCANGYLLECLAEWAHEKRIHLNLFGLDQSKKLVELARKRFATHTDNFWIGNAWNWTPPQRFRYVYTLQDCVPDDFFREYITRLLKHYVSKDGRLIIGSYGSNSGKKPACDLARLLQENGFEIAGRSSVGSLPITTIVWIDAHPC